jgi:branched-chain amino acid transport system ATP-binding protein
LLAVENVDFFYGRFQALRKVSLRVHEGEAVGLLGPNGHGKTTLLKVISGVYRAAAGSITFDGNRIDRIASDGIVRRGIVHVPQGARLYPQMTVEENLLLGAFLPKAWRKRSERLSEVLGIFPGLEDRREQRCQTLSGGERQMVAIGRGLMSSSKLLMLDEPTMGLAPLLGQELVRKIREIKERTGTSLLLVEQNVVYAMQLCDRIYLIENGEIVLNEKKDDILRNEHVKRTYLGVVAQPAEGARGGQVESGTDLRVEESP